VILTLSTAIGRYPHTAALKDGRVTSDRVMLRHVEVEPVNRAFRPMVNQLAYDVSEMALVTLMLAKAMGRPLRGIPVVLMRQSAHALLGVRADSALRDPHDLAGKTIGVRAYTQTTGTWVRGILQDQFGVDLQTLRWLTFEDAHVDGYVDPPHATRARDGLTLLSALTSGEIDAAVSLEPNAAWHPLLPDTQAAEADFRQLTGVQPINHVLVVRDDLARQHPRLTRDLFHLFRTAFGDDSCGLDAIKPAVDLLARYACEQAIIPRQYSAEDLFEPF